MRVVLTGASGQLGAYLIGRLLAAGHEVEAWGRRGGGSLQGLEVKGVDLVDPAATNDALDAADPEVIVHAAAMSRAEEVRRDPAGAWAVNVAGTIRLFAWCASRGRRLVYTSTDLVFAGTRAWNREDDREAPMLEYGRTKAAVEPVVLALERGLVARLSLLYGPTRSGRPVYYDQAIAAIRRGEPQTFFEDEFRTPLDLLTAAEIVTRLAASDARGLIHVAGTERVSRFELMTRVVGALGLDPGLVRANRQRDAMALEPRPADVSLDTSRLTALFPELNRPKIEQAVAQMHR